VERIPYDINDASRFNDAGKEINQYKARSKVRVLIDKIWYDDGYRSAVKGEVVSVDDDDKSLLIQARQVTTSLVPSPDDVLISTAPVDNAPAAIADVAPVTSLDPIQHV
jgi:hypothetical protein